MDEVTLKTSKMQDGHLLPKGTQKLTATNRIPNDGITIIGLSKATARTTLERVTAALHNNGFAIPEKMKIEFSPRNFSPANTTDYYDLPLALCMIALSSSIRLTGLTNEYICGRLDSQGTIVSSNTLKKPHTLLQALALYRKEQNDQPTLL